MHRSLLRLAIVGFMAAGLPLGTAAADASAAAVTHSQARPAVSGYGLDNTDPGATGCWDSHAYVVNGYHAPIYDAEGDYLGYVENWYSPDCGTNWSETFTSGGSATITVWTCRSNFCTSHFTINSPYAWSNQVYAPATTACAVGAIRLSNGFNGSNQACF